MQCLLWITSNATVVTLAVNGNLPLKVRVRFVAALSTMLVDNRDEVRLGHQFLKRGDLLCVSVGRTLSRLTYAILAVPHVSGRSESGGSIPGVIP